MTGRPVPLVARVRAADQTLRRIAEMHRAAADGGCASCGVTAPCPTARAVEGTVAVPTLRLDHASRFTPVAGALTDLTRVVMVSDPDDRMTGAIMVSPSAAHRLADVLRSVPLAPHRLVAVTPDGEVRL